MHDSRLEDRVRSILHTEGDRLPLTITSTELERRLVLRRRRATGRWVSLVAAAVAVLAVGAIVAFGDGWFQPSVGTVASPAPSGQAVASPVETVPSPVVVPGLGPIAPTPGSTVVMEFDPTLSGDGTSGTFHTGLDSTAYVVTVKLACAGTGVVEFTTPSGSISTDCPVASAGSHSSDNPALFTFPISNAVWEGSVTVSADVAFRWLAEVPPLPVQLPLLSAPAGTVGVEAASPSDRPVPGRYGTRVTRTVGQLPRSDTQRFALVCLGPGTVTVDMGPPGQPDPATTSDFTCDGEPGYDTWSLGTPGPLEVTITADPRIAWHVIAATEGSQPSVAP